MARGPGSVPAGSGAKAQGRAQPKAGCSEGRKPQEVPAAAGADWTETGVERAGAGRGRGALTGSQIKSLGPTS